MTSKIRHSEIRQLQKSGIKTTFSLPFSFTLSSYGRRKIASIYELKTSKSKVKMNKKPYLTFFYLSEAIIFGTYFLGAALLLSNGMETITQVFLSLSSDVVLNRTADNSSNNSEDEDEQQTEEKVSLEKCINLTAEFLSALENEAIFPKRIHKRIFHLYKMQETFVTAETKEANKIDIDVSEITR